MSLLPRAALAVALAAALAPLPARAQPAPPPAAPSPIEVSPPHPVTPLAAGYPEGAIGDAVVIVVITVNADGSVRSAAAAEGSPEPFASAAAAAARGFRFDPATRNGKPVAAKIRVEITFTAPLPEPPPQAAPAPPSSSPSSPSAEPPPPPPLEVDVHGEQPAPGAVSISRAEVRLLPGAFGDPFRAVEVLPGVTPLASGVPFFYVRGAPPGNVGYLLDGIRVPLLYHLGLGPAVVHPAIVDRVDLYPGGYPARYGRYAGGIVAGETRDPTGDWHGEANIRLVDSGLMLEGPLGDQGTFFVSGRVAYSSLLLSAISSSLRINYWDYGARATVRLGPRDRITVFAFGAYDYMGQRDSADTCLRSTTAPNDDRLCERITHTLFDTTFHRLDLRYEHSLGGPEDRVRQAVTLGFDHTGFDRAAGVTNRVVAARTEIQKRVSNAVLLRGGLDGEVDVYSADLARAFPDAGGFTSLFRSRSDLAMGARLDAVIDLGPRFQIVPGVRFDFFASAGNTAAAVDPRISVRYAITPSLRLLHAHGLASQTPSFILPGPGFQPSLRGGLQRSLQSSAGIEADLPWDLTATATVFRSAFFNMTDALGTHSATLSHDLFPSTFDVRFRGSSVGLELTLRRRLTKRLGGFLAYTLSRSTRSVPGFTRPSSYDRTHVFNGAIAADFGKGYKVGTRLFFYSGYPLGDLENSRSAPFFRFDWRAEKRWPVKTGWVSLVLEVANSFLAKETLADGSIIGPVVLPSIGVEGGF